MAAPGSRWSEPRDEWLCSDCAVRNDGAAQLCEVCAAPRVRRRRSLELEQSDVAAVTGELAVEVERQGEASVEPTTPPPEEKYGSDEEGAPSTPGGPPAVMRRLTAGMELEALAACLADEVRVMMRNAAVIVVGVSEYDEGSGWESLEGVARDAARMERLFREEFGWDVLRSAARLDGDALRDFVCDASARLGRALHAESYDGLVVVVAAHGDSGDVLVASDGDALDLTWLLDSLEGEILRFCPSFVKRPRLYLIDACRGPAENAADANNKVVRIRGSSGKHRRAGPGSPQLGPRKGRKRRVGKVLGGGGGGGARPRSQSACFHERGREVREAHHPDTNRVVIHATSQNYPTVEASEGGVLISAVHELLSGKDNAQLLRLPLRKLAVRCRQRTARRLHGRQVVTTYETLMYDECFLQRPDERVDSEDEDQASDSEDRKDCVVSPPPPVPARRPPLRRTVSLGGDVFSGPDPLVLRQELRHACDYVVRCHPRPQAERILRTLRPLVRKLAGGDCRFLVLKTANHRVQERLLRHEGVPQLLTLLGYRSLGGGQELRCDMPDGGVLQAAFRVLSEQIDRLRGKIPVTTQTQHCANFCG